MKIISHSEISTYLSCQKKWDLVYNKNIRKDSPDFQFGSMAHKVLETNVIPAEDLYPELKEHYGITSWFKYFSFIQEEINTFLADYDVLYREFPVENDVLKGIIDLVVQHKETKRIMLCDYKFTKNLKTLDDLEDDEQLYIYAYLYSQTQNIPIESIDICYISAPKANIDEPRVLRNGTLSKDKAQYTTYKMYYDKIKELNLLEEDYKDVLDYFASKPICSCIKMRIVPTKMVRVLTNINNVITDMQKGYILEKNGYDCKYCPYYNECKRGA